MEKETDKIRNQKKFGLVQINDKSGIELTCNSAL